MTRRVVHESEAELDGLPVRWLHAPCDDTPILWVHGVPNSADMWRPFLERVGGIAVDLPGFGRSGKPAEWPYGAEGFAAFLERFLDWRGIDRVRVVAHDWGAPALLLGERIERAVAIDVVPLLDGHRWHPVARLWRTPGVGELAMALTSGLTLRRIGRMPPELVPDVLAHFDHGTQRAILRLYRGADTDALARTGERLRALRAPTLIVWGEADPYLEPAWAQRLAHRLPDVQIRTTPGAGHWPWVGRPEIVENLCEFLESARQSSRLDAPETL
jgi:pimeloyl-ACP methyl ester carboxylesterase